MEATRESQPTEESSHGVPKNSLHMLIINQAPYLRLVALLVKRELKVKYRGSVLGYLWSLLNPLLYMIVLSAVFSQLVRGIENYSLYVFTGILMWNMTSMSLSLGAVSIVNGGSLLRKVRLPAWVFPVSSAASSSTNFFLSLAPYALLAIYFQAPVNSSVLLFPLVLIAYFGFVLGLSMLIAVANVFFRDVGHVLEPVLTIAFYATPIIYDPKLIAMPRVVEFMLSLNPFGFYARAFRATLMGYGHIDFRLIATLYFCAFVSLLAAFIAYKRSTGRIIYHL